jgi:hypothetical protein
VAADVIELLATYSAATAATGLAIECGLGALNVR